jgi:ABC-type transporter MlaC component
MSVQSSPPARATQDQVRILAIQHGIPEASRISGIKQDTIYKWAKRKHWNITAHSQSVQTVQSIPERLSDELADNERQTRLSLSRYAKKAAKASEEATLRDSPYVKQAAQTAAIVHRWDAKEQSQGNVVVNVAILGINPSEVRAEVIDVAEAD